MTMLTPEQTSQLELKAAFHQEQAERLLTVSDFVKEFQFHLQQKHAIVETLQKNEKETQVETKDVSKS